MSDHDIRLVPMTAEMYHRYFRAYENDPELYPDKAQYVPYVYTEEAVDRYIRRQADRGRVALGIEHGGDIIGEIVLKDIAPRRHATLSIAMKNAACKNRGYGTAAERLAIRYVFDDMDIPTLFADALKTNTRSRHVLLKAGFTPIKEEGDYVYYRIDREAEQANPSCG